MSCLSKNFHPQSAVASIYPWSSHDPLSHSSRITAFTIRHRVFAVLVLCLVVSFLRFPALSAAADERPPESSRGLGVGLAAAPVYMFPAKVDGGGTLSTTSLIFNADISRQLNEKTETGSWLSPTNLLTTTFQG